MNLRLPAPEAGALARLSHTPLLFSPPRKTLVERRTCTPKTASDVRDGHTFRLELLDLPDERGEFVVRHEAPVHDLSYTNAAPGEGLEPSSHGFKDRHPATRRPRNERGPTVPSSPPWCTTRSLGNTRCHKHGQSVRTEGVEPSHQLRHQHLKLACLPFHHVRMAG